ncbi:MAG: hypothetical protein IV094_12010 [Vitreoscilla sp.]|nr:hypothetical protein [Vitreoscilla sp.]
MKTPLSACLVAGFLSAALSPAFAAPTLIDQFTPGLGTLVGAGYDAKRKQVWAYADFSTTMARYSRAGALQTTVPITGGTANDADVEVARVDFTMNGTKVKAGTPLFVNGESGVAEIYALDRDTGAVLATLVTAFGASHVVGGAHHAARGSFFLVQDKVPGGSAGNRIAEIDLATGAVLNTFQTTGLFSVNFGDIEVSAANGNLFLVSSDEPRIAELTPAGALVQYHDLPLGVTSLSGIGLDDTRGEAWVSGTGGTVFHLGGLLAVAHAGGNAAGQTVSKVTCANLGDGSTVDITDGAPAWDCQDAGLAVAPGARVKMTIKGQANGVGDLAGTASGLDVGSVVCQNKSTAQKVTISDKLPSWNCVAAGLAVSAGDSVVQIVTARAQ